MWSWEEVSIVFTYSAISTRSPQITRNWNFHVLNFKIRIHKLGKVQGCQVYLEIIHKKMKLLLIIATFVSYKQSLYVKFPLKKQS